MAKVVGVDSSTQSVKVVLRDVDSGELIATSSRPHPDGTEVAPKAWWSALTDALSEIKEPYDAISIAGQQHGMVALDENGNVIRKALLWNDTRSATSASDLNNEVNNISKAVGSSLVAAFTASKVRWLAKNESDNSKIILKLMNNVDSYVIDTANNTYTANKVTNAQLSNGANSDTITFSQNGKTVGIAYVEYV